ncbi:MAG: hypothetical protein WCB51_05920 [Candidatus Dormiibacterota bacterium]
MTRRGGWVVVVVAIAAVAGVSRVLPSGSPAIYDGNCIANPYETLGGSPAPQPASTSFPASSQFPTSEVFTGETPPQAQLLMEPGTFDNSTALTISITPVPAPAVKPPNGTIEGNVYKFAAVNAAGVALQPKAGIPVTIVLRATASTPTPVIDRFDGTAWTPQPTFNSGCGNTFELTSTRLGEFAAVAPGGSRAPPPAASSGGFPVVVIVGALVLLLVVAIVVLFSLDRGRRRAG